MFTSSADNNKTIVPDIGLVYLLKCMLFFTTIHPFMADPQCNCFCFALSFGKLHVN